MNELIVPINTNSNIHLYEQIYQYIRSEILEGRLAQGERLPSSRALAACLQVSRSTVNLSYEQLTAEGYLESVPQKGYFVSKIEKPFHMQKKQESANAKQDEALRYSYHFTSNGIDMKEFPYRTWRKITREILNDERKELFALGQPQGDLELRQTIAHYLFSARGVICEPGQIVVGAGNDYLLMLLQLLLDKKSRIAFENPTYTKAYKIMSSLGFATCLTGMDENGICVQDLETCGADVAYVMPSHQFPTGIVMSVGRRNELLSWAAEKENRYLIEDDYDSEFRYRGKPIPALQGMDNNDKVIYIGTFSKAIAPAIRISFMVLPKSLKAKMEEGANLLSSTVSRIDQRILNEFISCGAFERHLNRMRKIYKGKHDMLLEALRDFRPQFKVQGDHAGSHMVLCARYEVTEEWLKESAAKAGVKIYCLSDYSLSGQKENPFPPAVILGYIGMDAKDILEGIQRLKTAWGIKE